MKAGSLIMSKQEIWLVQDDSAEAEYAEFMASITPEEKARLEKLCQEVDIRLSQKELNTN